MSKKLYLAFIDLAVFVAAYALAYVIAIEPRSLLHYSAIFQLSLPILLAIKLCVFLFVGMYRPVWRYASTNAIALILKACTLSTCAAVAGFFFLRIGIPRSILIIDLMLTLIFQGFVKYLIRIIREREDFFSFFKFKKKRRSDKERVLIYGAGDAGEMILREMLLNRSLSGKLVPIGFIDDYKERGRQIHNVPILGRFSDFADIVADHQVDEVIIAIPLLLGERMREVVSLCGKLNLRYKVIPRIGDIVNGRIEARQLRDVEISDLLKRPPQNLNEKGIEQLIRNKKVLITGAGGSIGKELALQIASFQPAELILVDHSEHNLYQVKTALSDAYPQLRTAGQLCSVIDAFGIEQIFISKSPDLVFHAAAYKHVPLCEDNVCQAVINNVVGTMRVVDAATKAGVERFIFISTDKAVNPLSIMGATKRLGELYIQSVSARYPTRFMTVRFGNVLESSGSAMPRFKDQIRRGGPVTVTHPEVTRYFMLLDEAVQLVLHSATIGQGGEIYILDMGKPVKILDLVRDLISLMGLRPDKDIKIQFTGLRKGEKLFEDLFHEPRNAQYVHPSILKAAQQSFDSVAFRFHLDQLLGSALALNEADCLRYLSAILPEFGQVASSQPSEATQDS